MNKKSVFVWASFLAVLVSSACVLTIPVPGPASIPQPVAPEQSLVTQTETRAPVSSSTAPFTHTPPPSLTASATLTFFPTITPIPTETLTPSITPTFPAVITLNPELPPETLTAIAGTPVASGDPIGSDYSCIFLGKKFADLTVLKPKYQFTMWWELSNAGKKSWESDGVLLSLVEGKKLSKDRTASLPFDVSVGQKVRVQIEMETPKEPGTYQMTWGLLNLRSNRHFCFFTLTIVVKK